MSIEQKAEMQQNTVAYNMNMVANSVIFLKLWCIDTKIKIIRKETVI